MDPDLISHEEWARYYAPTGAHANGFQVELPVGARLLAALDLRPTDTFLDLGCSTGAVCLLAALLAPLKEVIGIEICGPRLAKAEQALRRAREIEPHAPGLRNVRFLCGDFESTKDPEVVEALGRATVVYYAADWLAHFDAATGAAKGRCVERLPALRRMQPGTRLISLSRLAPDFEVWNEVRFVGAYELGQAYAAKKKRLRLALEYEVL